MRAVLFDPVSREFSQADVPMPVVRDDRVLLRVEVVGVCGSDVHFYRHGIYSGEPITEPQVLGHEFSATIEWIPASIRESRLRVGQRVATEPTVSCAQCEYCRSGRPNICPNHVFHGMPPTPGALQEFVVLPPGNLFPVPESLGPEATMLAEPLAIAVHAWRIAGIKKGETAAVLGCGPLGLGIIDVLAHHGVKVLVASDPLDWRARLAGEFGAEQVTLTEKETLEQVRQATDGRLVDYVFEVAGTPEALKFSMEVVRPGGTLVYVGICPNPMEIEFTQARRKELVWKWVRRTANAYPETLALLEAGHYPPEKIVTHRWPLGDAAAAFKVVNGYEDGIVKGAIWVAGR